MMADVVIRDLTPLYDCSSLRRRQVIPDGAFRCQRSDASVERQMTPFAGRVFYRQVYGLSQVAEHRV